MVFYKTGAKVIPFEETLRIFGNERYKTVAKCAFYVLKNAISPILTLGAGTCFGRHGNLYECFGTGNYLLSSNSGKISIFAPPITSAT